MGEIINLIKTHETLVGACLGAFLAAVFGMLAQALMSKINDKNEATKIIELVKGEMYLNFQLAKQMAITKKLVYEFQTEYYDKFLDKIMIIKDNKIKNQILDIYTGLKLYNAGIGSEYKLIIEKIREANENGNWGLEIENEEELVKQIGIYQFKKDNDEIIEIELSNYQGKDKRGYYGIICSIDKLTDKLK